MIMTMAGGLAVAMRFAVQVGVHMVDGPVLMGMDVEMAPSPAMQQPKRERDYDDADGRLRRLLQGARQGPAEEHDGEAKQGECSGMAEPPCQAEPRGLTGPAPVLVQQQRRHRGQMVRIERMPEAEEQRDDQWESHRDIIPWPRSEITDMVPSRRIDSRP